MAAGSRTGAWLFALVVVAGGVVAWLAATGKSPGLKRASQTLAASVAQLAASYASSSPEDEAGAPHAADAGATVHRQTGPLSSAQLGAPLVHGTFVTECGADDAMKVTVKVSVKNGHAVSVAVKTDPTNPTVAACIEKATREMQWDVSPRTDQVTVTY
jgi:hypothetical protein